jgi:WD40 repeat protein
MKRKLVIYPVILTLICFITSLVNPNRPPDTTIKLNNPDKLYSAFPKTFISDIFWRDKISPDGKTIAGRSEGDIYVLNLDKPQPVFIRKNTSLEWIDDFEWISGQELSLNGIAGGKNKIIVYNTATGKESASEATSGMTSNLKTGVFAYKNFDETKKEGGVYIRQAGKDSPELVLPGIYPASMCLSQDMKTLAYLYLKNPNSLCLGLYNIETKVAKDLSTDLDGSVKSEIAFDPENSHILISLITDKLDNIKKHQPKADRDLDLYAVHIATGAIIPVLIEEGDDILIGVNGNKIMWNKVVPNVRSCIVPIDGSKVIPLLPELSFMPNWNKDGDRLTVVFGDWRMADAPLNWNIGTFKIDTGAKITEELKPVVEGMFEEYGPTWSHDGAWMVYSAKQNTPAFPTVENQVTEDLFILKSGEKTSTQLTSQFAEITDADWSPDNKKILLSAMNKGENMYKAWLVTLADGMTGSPVVASITPEGMEGNVLSVAWSPDGKMIAAETSRGTKAHALWSFKPDGKDAKKITDFESLTFNTGLDFTPDGKNIIYSGFDGAHHQLFKVSPGGGKSEKITSNTYDLLFPQISPAGDRIAVTLFRHSRQIWVADITYE